MADVAKGEVEEGMVGLAVDEGDCGAPAGVTNEVVAGEAEGMGEAALVGRRLVKYNYAGTRRSYFICSTWISQQHCNWSRKVSRKSQTGHEDPMLNL